MCFFETRNVLSNLAMRFIGAHNAVYRDAQCGLPNHAIIFIGVLPDNRPDAEKNPST